jgi:hypothetical protein
MAAVILGGFADDAGLSALRALARATPGSSDDARRLRRGVAAVRAFRRRPPPTTPIAGALVRAALLWRAGLFFEVHEILEHLWRGLAGPERVVVQGLLQVAVAMHHLAHGNPRGAVSLFAKGRAKLERHGGVLADLDVTGFLAPLASWERSARAGRLPARLAIPVVEHGRSVSCVRARRPSGESRRIRRPRSPPR